MATSKDASKPVIVIVPGSFSPPSMYTTVNELLQSAGYETTVIYLPSVGDKEKASGVTLSDDGAAISAVVASYADQGKDIVLATHSYGGIAGAEGAKGLSKKEREENGKKGGIIRLVYITALIAQVGQSLGEVMAEIPPSQVIVDGDYLTLDPGATGHNTFSDLSTEEGLKWTAEMPGHSALTFSDKATYPAYKFIPMTYMLCEEDLVIPPRIQRALIELVEKESGRKVDVHPYPSGHAPNASRPKDMAKVIRHAAGEVL